MKTHALTVSLGVLRQEEFESVSPAVRQAIEGSTAELRRRYPASWFKREAARLRLELELAYDVMLEDA